jgi:hypothetical protein
MSDTRIPPATHPKPWPYVVEVCRLGVHAFRDDHDEIYIDGCGDMVDVRTLAEARELCVTTRRSGGIAVAMRRENMRWVADLDDPIDGGDWEWDLVEEDRA